MERCKNFLKNENEKSHYFIFHLDWWVLKILDESDSYIKKIILTHGIKKVQKPQHICSHYNFNHSVNSIIK